MTFVNELKRVCPDNFLEKKEDLYVYAHDTSQNPDNIILPRAVVFPKNTKEVSEVVKILNKYNVPFIPRAQGTNHCGATRLIKESVVAIEFF